MGKAQVERFGTWSGVGLGWAGVVGFSALAVTELLRASSAGGYAIAGWLAWVALLMYVGLVRPRVEAHDAHLLLRGSFRDVEVPWHLIDGIEVRHTLRVHVEDDTHHSPVVTRAGRSRGRDGPAGAGLAVGRMAESVAPQPTTDPARRPDSASIVEMRLRDLASERRGASTDRDRVRTRWAAETCAVGAVVTIAALALVVVAV